MEFRAPYDSDWNVRNGNSAVSIVSSLRDLCIQITNGAELAIDLTIPGYRREIVSAGPVYRCLAVVQGASVTRRTLLMRSAWLLVGIWRVIMVGDGVALDRCEFWGRGDEVV